MDSSLHHVLARYELPAADNIEVLGSAGGFSGAQLWSVHADESHFCVRRWPAVHPDQEQLSWIHRVLKHSFQCGCRFVAAPISTRNNESCVRHDQSLWEISPWMPGTADFCKNSSDMRLNNMMQALARFHQTSAQVNLDFRQSINLQSRIKQLREFPRLLDRLDKENQARNSSEELQQFQQLILRNALPVSQILLQQLQQFETAVVPVQPVIRDIWHDHVLFTDDEVSGIVDFGAMQMDNIAFDIARLLGSTVGDDMRRWSSAIGSYHQIRPLSEFENRLLPLLDQSTVLLGSINWLKWIFIDQRQFENWTLVWKRVEFLHQRFNTLISLELGGQPYSD